MKRELTDAQKAQIQKITDALLADARAINDALVLLRNANTLQRIPGVGPMLQDRGLFKDAVAAQLMAKALEYAVAQGILEVRKYNVWRDVFPIDRDMPAGADQKVFTIWSGSATAAWYRGGGKHPNVSIGAQEVKVPYSALTLAFTIDWLEMLATSYAGVSAEAMKAAQVIQGLDDFVEDLVFLGDSAMSRPGLIDHTSITQANLTNGDWNDSGTTAAEIVQDVQVVLNTIVTASTGDRRMKGLQIYAMCSPTHYRKVTSTIANTYTNQTIAQLLTATDPMFGGFIESPMHGETAGGAGDYVSFGPFADPDSNNVSLSMDAVRMPPDVRGGFIEQPMCTKAHGYHCRYPYRFLQGEGANV